MFKKKSILFFKKMPKQSNPAGILNRNPYDNHTGWHNGGQNFGCVDRRTYDLANVQPKQVIKAAEWEKLRQTLNTEEARRAKTFENSGSRSSYYGSSFFYHSEAADWPSHKGIRV